MHALLLKQLTSRTTNHKNKTNCRFHYPSPTASPLPHDHVAIKSIEILHLSSSHMDRLRKTTKRLVSLPPGCRLRSECLPLKTLLPPSSLHPKGHVRMFHGTTSRHLSAILKKGLLASGGGALGKGFYMTPSFEKAALYTSKIQQSSPSSGYPIFLEIDLPSDMATGCFDPDDKKACCGDAVLFTNPDEFWQFVLRDQAILSSLRFRILIPQ